jgi:hypothetical protein
MVMLIFSHGVATLVALVLFIFHCHLFFVFVLLFFLCGLVVFIAYVLLLLSHSSCYFSHILLLFFSCWIWCSSCMVLLLFLCCATTFFALCYCSCHMILLLLSCGVVVLVMFALMLFLHWCSSTFWPNRWLLLFLCWWCSYFPSVSLVFSPFYPIQLGAWSIKLTNKPLKWSFYLFLKSLVYDFLIFLFSYTFHYKFSLQFVFFGRFLGYKFHLVNANFDRSYNCLVFFVTHQDNNL